ncbi:phosphotransferase [Streptacidiphilus sp. EB103A]|uniref:phosphotransferase n=1 Tax=Streptacidiphilus sp. EB103A TaxID=3156275 RepID=UPI0035168DB6
MSPAVERHRSVVDLYVLLQREDGKVLLLERANTGYADGQYCPPSGHMDAGEHMVEGAARELFEETGVVVAPDDLDFVHLVHHRSPLGEGRVGVVFRALRWNGTPYNKEPEKCAGLLWADPHTLPANTVPYTAAALANITEGLSFSLDGWPTQAEPGPQTGAEPPPLGPPTVRPAGTPALSGAERSTASCDLPDDLAALVADVAGLVEHVVDFSHTKERTAVFQVTTGQGRVLYVKRHHLTRFHDREVTALKTWVPNLGAAAPTLLAADSALRAVVVTSVPGHILRGAVHPPETQRRIFERIGALTAAIHCSAPGQSAASPPSTLGKLERHLDGARSHLRPGDEEFIRETAAGAADLPALDLVPTHGDLQLRNLLWDAASSTLSVIDFERSEPGPAIRDLVRLSDAWAGQPQLYEAFLCGYGRALTMAEEERFALDTVLDAVSGIQFGAAHGDLELLERGTRTLARLRTGSPSLTPRLGGGR